RWQSSDTVRCHLTAAIGGHGSARVSQSLSDLLEPTTTTTSQLYHTSTSTLTTIAQFDTSLFCSHKWPRLGALRQLAVTADHVDRNQSPLSPIRPTICGNRSLGDQCRLTSLDIGYVAPLPAPQRSATTGARQHRRICRHA